MKIFKILFLIAISTFLLSCTFDIIDDTDGDGVSDTLNLVNDIYEYRTKYFMQDNIRKYTSRLKNPPWYKPNTPLYVTYSSTSEDNQYIEKNGVKYKPLKEYVKTAEVYKITEDATTSANVNKFVFITLEPVPIFKKNMVILLVSKNMYDTAELAKTDAERVDIPEIKMNISHLDLVFDPTIPEADYLSYENVAENITAIKANYNLLEFFGTSYTYDEKKELLIDYYAGYSTLF